MTDLTPDQIANAQFVGSVRGYNREDVDAFLRGVADDYQRLVEELRGLRAATLAGEPDAPGTAVGATSTVARGRVPRGDAGAHGTTGEGAQEASPTTAEITPPAAGSERDEWGAAPSREPVAPTADSATPAATGAAPTPRADTTATPQADQPVPTTVAAPADTVPTAPAGAEPAEPAEPTAQEPPLATSPEPTPTSSVEPAPDSEAPSAAAAAVRDLLLRADEEAWRIRDAVEEDLEHHRVEVLQTMEDATRRANQLRDDARRHARAQLDSPTAITELADTVSRQLREADTAAEDLLATARANTRQRRRAMYERLANAEAKTRAVLDAANNEACALLRAAER